LRHLRTACSSIGRIRPSGLPRAFLPPRYYGRARRCLRHRDLSTSIQWGRHFTTSAGLTSDGGELTLGD
jgi:hypothetical protein